MAELNTGNGGNNKGGRIKRKRLSTKIDMTPMVDLAFLLLTFFMLATSFNKSYVLEIPTPERRQKPSGVKENRVLSITLDENDKIYYYIGVSHPEIKTISKEGIGKMITEYQSKIPHLIVLVKPTEKSKYQNLVDVFDQLILLKVPTYSLADITPQELDLIRSSKL